MTTLDIIKSRIRYLYENNPNIHMNISINHPKIHLENDPAVIKGVYSHVFRIEEYSNGAPQCHTIQYTDIVTKQIEIVELATELN